MKLIFLDIDGVLVTRRPGVMEERLLRNLASVVSQTGAQIVLSSDWRRHPLAAAEARRCLKTVGLDFIGCTPCMSAFVAQRPTEILQWKKLFVGSGGQEPISHWVAIDDRPLLEERNGRQLRGHFVQTQPLRGLTEAAVEECVKILNRSTGLAELPADDWNSSIASGAARPTAPPARLAALTAPAVPAAGPARGLAAGPALGAPRGRAAPQRGLAGATALPLAAATAPAAPGALAGGRVEAAAAPARADGRGKGGSSIRAASTAGARRR